VAVKMFQKGLTGKQWLRVVDDERRRLKTTLVFGIADGHPSNGIVGEGLSLNVEGYSHSCCFSHTLVKPGSKFDAPLLDGFLTTVNGVFKNSLVARQRAALMLNEQVKRKHKVRWWTSFPMIEQWMRNWNVLPRLIADIKSEGLCEETLPKLEALSLQGHSSDYSDLVLQLNAVHDGARHFVTATYFLEGSGFLSPFVYNYIKVLELFSKKILGAIECPVDLPNCRALIANLRVPQGPVWAKIKRVLRPGLEYFLEHFVEFKHDSKARPFRKSMELFSFARIFHPVYGRQLLSDPKFNIDTFLAGAHLQVTLSNLGPSILSDLKNDFGKLLTAFSTNVMSEKKYRPPDVLTWWRTFGSITGSWAAAARLFALLQPSEASAERAFAMLRLICGDQQTAMLEDLVELRLKKRFKMKDVDAGA
jgi:hypothetical protein